jgi:hypothetical protein
VEVQDLYKNTDDDSNVGFSFTPHVRGLDPLSHACETWVPVSQRTSVVWNHCLMHVKLGLQFRNASPWFGNTDSCV